ncbi:hypothetical protein POM88_021986 [Heracleum sosnowskyi]|uniref:Replication protein A 70 kDa DNA-binding subunit B/D first OB fold domain-containing protein n=1 Tax=Heracleum sosnowskyi TaxID=360622 RepID=A0AAD8IFY7_9APIA|nr:hypothetical protein POM88_021986 [Heracleum sosnowskyi]
MSIQAARGRENLKGYNLILLDDNNSHVQACIYVDQCNSMADNIDEGSIYVMSNFYTKEAIGSLKPVSLNFLINFPPSTTVQKLTEDDFMIPLHKFEFVDLGDLFSIASNCPNDEYPEYSTDIIGVVEDFEHVSSIKTKFGQRNIVRFRITDGRNSQKVTIWGDLAVKAENDYNKVVETLVIAIVTSTRLKTYKNSNVNSDGVPLDHDGATLEFGLDGFVMPFEVADDVFQDLISDKIDHSHLEVVVEAPQVSSVPSSSRGISVEKNLEVSSEEEGFFYEDDRAKLKTESVNRAAKAAFSVNREEGMNSSHYD